MGIGLSMATAWPLMAKRNWTQYFNINQPTLMPPVITLQPSKLSLSQSAGGLTKWQRLNFFFFLVESYGHLRQTQSVDKWSTTLSNNVPVFFCKIQDCAITIRVCTPQTWKVTSFLCFHKPLQHKQITTFLNLKIYEFKFLKVTRMSQYLL